MTDSRALLNFDSQATTPCAPEVFAAMEPYWNQIWGNASNRQSRIGLQASAAVGLAREQLAEYLHVKPERLIFTSGATEANNLALLGYARARSLELGQPGHLITVSTEHKSVIGPLKQLQKEGFRLTEIDPASDGLLYPEQLVQAFEKDTFLVSVMMANNEIGVLQPLDQLAELCQQRGVVFHSDAVQAVGKINFEIDKIGINLLTFSGHKIYGPKGIGALVIQENTPILPLQWGGGQEHGIRPGTIPVPLVVGLAKAAEIAFEELDIAQVRLFNLRNELWNGLREKIPDVMLNGSMEHRLPNNLNITIPGIRGRLLHQYLRPFMTCSSGSACSNGEPSHVLMALGRSKFEAESSLRLSLGRYTTIEHIKEAVFLITKVVSDLRKE